MVNAKDFFSGNFLRAEDCKGGEICEILEDAEITEIQTQEGKTKAVMNLEITFDVAGKKSEKTFTPNKTNGNILTEAFGEETKNWIGKKFKIDLVKVRVFKELKNSIIVVPLEAAPKV